MGYVLPRTRQTCVLTSKSDERWDCPASSVYSLSHRHPLSIVRLNSFWPASLSNPVTTSWVVILLIVKPASLRLIVIRESVPRGRKMLHRDPDRVTPSCLVDILFDIAPRRSRITKETNSGRRMLYGNVQCACRRF